MDPPKKMSKKSTAGHTKHFKQMIRSYWKIIKLLWEHTYLLRGSSHLVSGLVHPSYKWDFGRVFIHFLLGWTNLPAYDSWDEPPRTCKKKCVGIIWLPFSVKAEKIKPGNGKSYGEFVDQNLHLPNLVMTNSSPWEMAHRSRWFTGLPIKNWWIFHGKLLVITRGYNLFSIAMIDYPRVNPSWDGFAKEHHGKGLVSQWGRYKIRRPRPWPRQGRRLGPPQVWNFSFFAFQGQTHLAASKLPQGHIS